MLEGIIKEYEDISTLKLSKYADESDKWYNMGYRDALIIVLRELQRAGLVTWDKDNRKYKEVTNEI
jgi:hypothetical protein